MGFSPLATGPHGFYQQVARPGAAPGSSTARPRNVRRSGPGDLRPFKNSFSVSSRTEARRQRRADTGHPEITTLANMEMEGRCRPKSPERIRHGRAASALQPGEVMASPGGFEPPSPP
ncbi:conserved hypothetical protein [Methylococcus capsulatus str. Bath]|uniref:Uncharacterized protein n=1 Tax=Methylococcus capsulatus (strain ATCC 33009 / NCIMB 11132 / Bath) TaxID=243233 RepID=Q605H4_METCA|nr:conserved hypothetical protein [Methylococcus capsulatus str. Bath]